MDSNDLEDSEHVELRLLYVNLLRLGISNYLMSDEFRHLMVEVSYESKWTSYLKEYGVTGNSKSAGFEAPFLLLLNNIYEDFRYSDEKWEIITKIAIDFYRWCKISVDLKNVLSALKDLEVDEEILQRFKSAIRRIKASKADERPSLTPKQKNSSKVFLIHGHDKAVLLELEKVLKEDFGLIPVIIQESPNEGLDTIISKFERLANDCAMAIAIFTPDDKLSADSYRARQNVIFELGYFLGRDQRSPDPKIIILKKGNIETPSDINGVLYIEFKDSVSECMRSLIKQFASWKIMHKQ